MEKLEGQLDEILTRKKREINQSLEEKIKMEKVEAEKELNRIEESYKKEKESLNTYKTLYAEIEQKNLEYHEKIKGHLDKATSYQETISELTSNTLSELRAISQISREMQEYRDTSENKMSAIRKDLEEKYGIETSETKTNPQDQLDFNLDQELSKLSKIKELLGGKEDLMDKKDVISSAMPAANLDEEDAIKPLAVSKQEEEDTELLESLDITEDDSAVEYSYQHPDEEEEAQAPVEDPPLADLSESDSEDSAEILEYISEDEENPVSGTQTENGSGLQEIPAADYKIETSPQETVVEEPEDNVKEIPSEIESVSMSENTEEVGIPSVQSDSYQELQQLDEMKSETNFEDAFEELESHRKGSCTEDNGDVSYFQKNGRIIIDGECLISTLNNSLEGAKKLYAKLGETESPKEQFFIKQDIIRFQEILRKLMLVTIRMCEKEDCSLPKYTLEILNVDILKNILEKVSMENWSDQSDFAAFDDYAKSLKDAYYARITPPALYLQSIIDELEMN